MVLDVLSYRGLGPIQFGMSRKDVRNLLGENYRASTMSFGGETDISDHFMFEGILIFYDKDDRCIAIQVYEPSQVTMNGHVLVGIAFDEVRDWFAQLDPDFQDEDTGLMSKKFGISLFTEDARRCPHEKVLHVFAFNRGYFEHT